MDQGLAGRMAIVEAASKGLRRAVADELAGEGAYVSICGRTASTLAETAAHLQKTTGGEVFHRALDVIESGVVTTFVAAGDARFSRIDVCVTNSGGPPSNMSRNTPPEAWRAAVGRLLMCTVFFGQGNFFANAKRESRDV